MTVLETGHSKGVCQAPRQVYRYSIDRLKEIGCRTNLAVDMTRFGAQTIEGQST
jgi:hypothetical protein